MFIVFCSVTARTENVTAMRSTVSVIIAEIVMQNLEENLPRRLTDKSYGIPFNHYSANTALIKLR